MDKLHHIERDDYYLSAIPDIIYKFWEEKFLLDVTLICQNDDEMVSIQAHKIVLSACSLFFESLLRSNQQPHPVIILKDVKSADLRDILIFIYKGQLNVEESRFNDILSVGKLLMIKGIVSDFENTIIMKYSAPSKTFSPKKRPRGNKKSGPKPNRRINKNHPIPIANSSEYDPNHYVNGINFRKQRFSYASKRNGRSKQIMIQGIFIDDPAVPGRSLCTLCMKWVKSKWHHNQTHFCRNHPCPRCTCRYSRIDTLKIHAKKKHGLDIGELDYYNYYLQWCANCNYNAFHV